MDGVRFTSKEELIETMWEAYKDKMTREEYEKYVAEHMIEEEK